MTNINKLNILVTELEKKLKECYKTSSDLRKENIVSIQNLYEQLGIFKKHENFDTIFSYKAMNLSGIGLKENDFGEIREGKYVQIISIDYNENEHGKRVAKNSSLGYFGKAESLEEEVKRNIIEFVLRWRYEKTFRHTKHYEHLLSKLSN